MKTFEKLEKIKSGKLKAVDNIKQLLNAIEKDNHNGKKINAVLSLNKNALADAKKVDDKISKGQKTGRLAGLGIIIKSNICVKGLECNCASKTLEGWIAPYNAEVINRIKNEDGIIIGMANMDEFACGGSGETSAFGPCENPSALGLIPGGTSSGSAASIAAGFADLTLGSDTGGSIRNPASHCGVVGVKPSYSLVSRYGLIDMAMSFDQIGPITGDVESATLLLDIIKGRDEKDSITLESEKIKLTKLNNISVGILPSVSSKEVQNLIDSKIRLACEKFGWETKNIELKHIDLAIQTYYPIVYTEVFSGTRKFDGRRFGKKIEDSCGPEVLRRILGGSEITKAEYEGRYYKKALQVKEIVKKEFAKAFDKVDCIIIPTVPRLPHKLGSQISPEEMYSYDVLTTPANLAEICAVSIPAGKISGIPVGIQILCKKLDESKMLSIAKMIEEIS
ncbi:MAG: amidase family protein [Candidatus Pacearchaeota archaeon]